MPLINPIYANATVSISDLRSNPSLVFDDALNAPVAVLNHNKVAAYIVSPELFERMCGLIGKSKDRK